MSSHPRRNPRLQERDYDLLDHVMRYRVTTPQILHQLFFADCDRNAVTKVTSRLCDHDFLESHPLYGSNSYFTLGKAGARLFGLAARRLGALGPIALYRDFGVLMFCARTGARREKLRVSEIAKRFPQILVRGVDSSHYYLDSENDTVRLGHIWVEGGGTTEHIVRSVKQDIIEPRRSVPALLDYIDKGRFVVAVVTMTAEKRDQIAGALNTLPTSVLFRVEHVPELIQLLPGARNV
ncbi:MAG TPA: hypothetical protein VGN12_20710 [Pirellulales bacterium]|jgi:hypothetical protein